MPDTIINRQEVLAALEKCDHYILTTSNLLGISRGKLATLMATFNIQPHTNRVGVKPTWKINNKKCVNIYYKMMGRCYNPKNKDYVHYGLRGIEVCDEWRNNRDKFSEYIMSLDNFDCEGYSLDRINNEYGYTPSNVRFATRKEQARNRRSNRYLLLNGIEYSVVEFSEKFSIEQDFIKDRLNIGFTPEEIIKIPCGMKRKSYYKSLHTQ